MRIAMVGSGYVGLVSGVCLADFGHDVVCVDTDAAKVVMLRGGEVPIHEPGLIEMLRRVSASGQLSFTTDLREALKGAEAVFIAVGTPSRRGDGYADLTYVYGATRDIAAALEPGAVVVTKSTVPVGTGDEVERIIRAARPGLEFSVASNPEFLREGAAIADFKHPDRIVIGSNDQRGKDVLTAVYRPLYLNNAPFMHCDRRTAELTKYAANAFLATKITFINEIADLCEQVGANVQDVARGIGLDNRIGSKFLHAGPGYGGSCFPKDTLALINTAQDVGVSLSIVESVATANTKRKRGMARRIIAACGGAVRGKTIAVLGLTFKPNTDDMRDAPSIDIIAALQDKGAVIRAFDPIGQDQAKLVLDKVTFASDPYACVEGADALVIVTEWEMFRALDFRRIKGLMHSAVAVDLRNIYPIGDLEALGFTYVSVGRGRLIEADETAEQPRRAAC